MFRFLVLATISLAFSLCFPSLSLSQTYPRPTPAPRPVEDPTKAGATVRGRVVYSDSGRPVRFVTIELIPERREQPATPGSGLGNGSVVFTAAGSQVNGVTNQNGEFVIKNVRPGTYVANVRSDGILGRDAMSFMRRANPEDFKAFFVPFDVVGNGEIQIALQAVRAASISGRIFYADGEPAVGVRVEAMRKDGSAFFGSFMASRLATTDDRGSYRITGLPEGEYIVRAVEPYRHQETTERFNYFSARSSMLHTYYPNGDRSDSATSMKIQLGEEIQSVDITLPDRKLFALSGTVVFKGTKEPLAGFMVAITRADNIDRGVVDGSGNSTNVTTDESGEWKVANLPQGKYNVTVVEGYRAPTQPQTQQSQKEPVKRSYSTVRKEVELADGDVSGFIIELPVESSVVASVRDENGKIVDSPSGVFLVNEKTKRSVGPDMQSNRRPGQTKPTGDQTIRFGKLEAGDYRVRVSSQNFYLVSATLGGGDVVNQTFKVGEGDEIKGLTIVVSKGMGTISGVVENYDPNVGYSVIVTKADSATSVGGTLIGRDGKFRLRVAPGTYRVVLLPNARITDPAAARERFEELLRNAREVELRAGETIEVVLQIPAL